MSRENRRFLLTNLLAQIRGVTAGLPGDRHLAAIPEKSGIIYPNISGLGLYSKLN
jgi:hypothetical protein